MASVLHSVNWKNVAVGVSLVAGVLAALASYVGLGGPVPATDHDLDAIKGELVQRIAGNQEFAEDTREIVLLDKLFLRQEELSRTERALSQDPDNEQLLKRIFDLKRQIILLERQLDDIEGHDHESES